MIIEGTTISLFGNFALRRKTLRQKLPLAGKTKQLFILLAANFDHGLRREYIIETVWPDRCAKKAASSLSTGLCRLKQCLKVFPGLEIQCINEIVRLGVKTPAFVDAQLLETAMMQVVDARNNGEPFAEENLTKLSNAVECCNGEFLEGCPDLWVLPLREKFAALYVQALTILMHEAATEAHYEEALAYGREILSLDPFREGTQRDVMLLYALNGQRAQAILQFQSLKDMLQTELGIKPMPETIALYIHITTTSDCLGDFYDMRDDDWTDLNKVKFETVAPQYRDRMP